MLKINAESFKEIMDHAEVENPNECCGVLGVKDEEVIKVYRMDNTTKSPYRYTLDPLQHLNVLQDLDREGLVGAIYHSHTHSEAYPSDTDVRLAEPWPDTLFVLISLSEDVGVNNRLRAFFIEDGNIIEENVVCA
jgi:proteasome lid subunit RPN8/RPN11